MQQNSPRVELMTITPALARAWRTAHTNFRRLDEVWAATMANDLFTDPDTFVNAGVTIKLSHQGELLDGQHRLRAIEILNRPVKMWVCKGVVDALNIDNGRKRTLGQYLQSKGEKNCTNLSALIRWVACEESGNFRNNHQKVTLSYTNAFSILGKHPDLREALGKSHRAADMVPHSVIAYVYWRARKIDPAIVDQFIEGIATGVGLTEGDPCLLLRQRRISEQKSKSKMLSMEWMALTIKAWNAYQIGRRLQFLRWRSVGPGAEEFPTFQEPEGGNAGQLESAA